MQNLLKEIVQGAVAAGNRAATAAVRSVTKDSKGLVKKVNKVLSDIEQRCDDVIGGDEDLPDGRRPESPDVVDAEFEPSPKTKTRRKPPSRDRS